MWDRLILPLEEEESAGRRPGEFALIRYSRRAMATTFEIALPLGTPHAREAAEEGLDLIDSLEDQLTIYRDHSEVSGINQKASLGPVTVEPELFDLLQTAAGITQETAGAFDIAIGALVKAWGFFQRQPQVPAPDQRLEAMNRTGSRHLILNAADRSVKFRVPGLEINLGSIGKGYALDRVATLLRDRWGIRSGLLHGGGSSVLAIGSPPHDSRGWTVSVRHPWDNQRTLGNVLLRNEAMATSAATFQHFEHEGQKLGHVLDPRNGWPASGTASASAIAASAAQADALSTAFFILGLDATRTFVSSRPHLGAVILPDGDGVAPVALQLERRYSPPAFRYFEETDLSFLE